MLKNNQQSKKQQQQKKKEESSYKHLNGSKEHFQPIFLQWMCAESEYLIQAGRIDLKSYVIVAFSCFACIFPFPNKLLFYICSLVFVDFRIEFIRVYPICKTAHLYSYAVSGLAFTFKCYNSGQLAGGSLSNSFVLPRIEMKKEVLSRWLRIP